MINISTLRVLVRRPEMYGTRTKQASSFITGRPFSHSPNYNEVYMRAFRRNKADPLQPKIYQAKKHLNASNWNIKILRLYGIRWPTSDETWVQQISVKFLLALAGITFGLLLLSTVSRLWVTRHRSSLSSSIPIELDTTYFHFLGFVY